MHVRSVPSGSPSDQSGAAAVQNAQSGCLRELGECVGTDSTELRLEAYNVQTRRGEITRTIGGPRVVQLAAKLRF